MRIRIEPRKLEEVYNFFNVVRDYNKGKPLEDQMGVILDSDQGHFIHVVKKKKCPKCGYVFDPKEIACAECGEIAIGRSLIVYMPLGVGR